MKQLLTDFIRLLFPHVCLLCGNRLCESEKHVCLNCLFDLPLTNLHRVPDNRMEQLFWGQARIDHATALYYFEKGNHVQQLLHQIKYKGNRELAVELGRILGEEIKDSPVAQVDCIVPIPLHPRRQKSRGYNQSQLIAEGLAAVLNLPIENQVLWRTRFNDTQTHKNAFERWRNSESLFCVSNGSALEGKRVLIVDDVVTTGSTFVAAAKALIQITNIQLNCATVALAV
ncbi:MAG: ComF family protein [Paludibacteraceae bacterium]|nr:ComF family protein [Paludibacteraceae bacterium]